MSTKRNKCNNKNQPNLIDMINAEEEEKRKQIELEQNQNQNEDVNEDKDKIKYGELISNKDNKFDMYNKFNIKFTDEDKEKFLKMDDEKKISTFEKVMEFVNYQEDMTERFNMMSKELDKIKDVLIIKGSPAKPESPEYYTPKKIAELVGEVSTNKDMSSELRSTYTFSPGDMKELAHNKDGTRKFLQQPPFEKINLKGSTVDTNLGDYLKQRGITQVWLAEQIGVDKTTIVNIIKKPKSISLLNAYKISKILSADIETLFPFIQGKDE